MTGDGERGEGGVGWGATVVLIFLTVDFFLANLLYLVYSSWVPSAVPRNHFTFGTPLFVSVVKRGTHRGVFSKS